MRSLIRGPAGRARREPPLRAGRRASARLGERRRRRRKTPPDCDLSRSGQGKAGQEKTGQVKTGQEKTPGPGRFPIATLSTGNTRSLAATGEAHTDRRAERCVGSNQAKYAGMKRQ
ncbi:hypothetical protein FE772_03470 [Lysobacter enzymogenes]|nr:hypothetical protein [Lysobacter enzymogenes]QCW24870.1 hypothetical protein FE772_03470 [Lysobacter enzymogenes]